MPGRPFGLSPGQSPAGPGRKPDVKDFAAMPGPGAGLTDAW